MLAAKRQYEERKVKHIGYMMAAIAYHEEISVSAANWSIRMADDLSWTQFVMLSVVGCDDPDVRDLLPNRKYSSMGGQSWECWALENEFADLGYGKKDLIGASGTEGDGETGSSLRLPVTDLNFRSQHLRNSGMLIHHLLFLDKVSRVSKVAMAEGLTR